jgi:hypothetical protein
MLWVSLVWTFDFYLNLAHHIVDLTEGTAELDQVIETEMTQKEVEKFEEDWRNLWNPEADSSHFD